MVKKNFKAKLNLACGNDDLRPILNYIYFNNGNAVATNAHILIISPLRLHGFELEEIQRLEGYCISAELFKTILKFHRVYVGSEGVILCKSKTGDSFEVKLDLMVKHGVFTNYEAVIPKSRREINEIGLNLNLLALAKDLIVTEISGNAKINLFGKDKAVVIESNEILMSGQTLLIMPLNLNP